MDACFGLTVQTPWGQFVVGKRPWAFGIGLQYSGMGCEWGPTTTESILLNAPLAHSTSGSPYYPFRFAGSSSNPLVTDVLGDPYNLPEYLRASGAVVPGQYDSRADGGGTFSKDFLAYIQYITGP